MYLHHVYDSTINGYRADQKGVGTTCAAWEESVQVMSDIWENLWTGVEYDPETGEFSRFYSNRDQPVIDAPESIIAEWNRFKVVNGEYNQKIRNLNYYADDAEKSAFELRNGRKVVVVRGRKVAKGTEGIVLKTGLSQYGTWVLMGIGEKGEDERYAETAITTPRNLEVIPDDEVAGNIAAMRAEIERLKVQQETMVADTKALCKMKWDEAQIKAMGDC